MGAYTESTLKANSTPPCEELGSDVGPESWPSFFLSPLTEGQNLDFLSSLVGLSLFITHFKIRQFLWSVLPLPHLELSCRPQFCLYSGFFLLPSSIFFPFLKINVPFGFLRCHLAVSILKIYGY